MHFQSPMTLSIAKIWSHNTVPHLFNSIVELNLDSFMQEYLPEIQLWITLNRTITQSEEHMMAGKEI